MPIDIPSNQVPVIAIDGPGGSGKGTIAFSIATTLGFHLLDSGALYRIVGLAAVRAGISFEDTIALANLAENLDLKFVPKKPENAVIVLLSGEDVTGEIRTETGGYYASRVAAVPEVRAALMKRQWAFRQPPGLVADGRDMGTVVFPDAKLKVFLTATPEERAQRRYNQLENKGESASMADLLADIIARDERDTTRLVAPLRPAHDALVIDSTDMSVEEVNQVVLRAVRERGIA